MKSTIKVNGMTCNNCVRHVKEAIESVSGVTAAEVDLQNGIAQVEHNDLDINLLIEAIEEEGYEAKSQQ